MALRRSPRLQALQDRLAAAAAAAGQPAPANIIVQPARGQGQCQRNGNRRNGNGNQPAAVVGNLGAAQGANQPDPLQAPIPHLTEREIIAEFDFSIRNVDYVEKCLVSDRGVVGIWKARAQMLTRQIFDRNAQPATIQFAAASLRNTVEVAKNFGKGFKLFSGEYLKRIGDARRALNQLSQRYSVTSAYAAQRFLLRARLEDLFWAPLLVKSAALDVEYHRLYVDCMRDVSSPPVAYYITQLPRRNGRGRAQPQVPGGHPAQPGHANAVVAPAVQVAPGNPVNIQPVALVVPGHVPIAVAAPAVQNANPNPMPPQNNANVNAAVAVPIVQPAAVNPTAAAPQANTANPMPQPNANGGVGIVMAGPIVPPVAVNPTAAVSQANSGPTSVSSTSSASIISLPSSGGGPNVSYVSVSAAGANNIVNASRSQPAIPRSTSAVQGPIAQIPLGVPVGSHSAVVGVASASHAVTVAAAVTAAVQAPASRLPTPAARNILAAQSGSRAVRPQGQARPPQSAGSVQMRPAVQRPLVPRPLATRPLVPRPPALMTQSVPRLQASQGQAGPSNSSNRANATPGTNHNSQQLGPRQSGGYLAPTQSSLNRAVARGVGPVRRADVQRVRPSTLTFAPYPPVRRTLRPASPVPSSSGGAGPSGPRKRSSSADAGRRSDGEPAVKRSSSRQ